MSFRPKSKAAFLILQSKSGSMFAAGFLLTPPGAWMMVLMVGRSRINILTTPLKKNSLPLTSQASLYQTSRRGLLPLAMKWLRKKDRPAVVVSSTVRLQLLRRYRRAIEATSHPLVCCVQPYLTDHHQCAVPGSDGAIIACASDYRICRVPNSAEFCVSPPLLTRTRTRTRTHTQRRTAIAAPPPPTTNTHLPICNTNIPYTAVSIQTKFADDDSEGGGDAAVVAEAVRLLNTAPSKPSLKDTSTSTTAAKGWKGGTKRTAKAARSAGW